MRLSVTQGALRSIYVAVRKNLVVGGLLLGAFGCGDSVEIEIPVLDMATHEVRVEPRPPLPVCLGPTDAGYPHEAL